MKQEKPAFRLPYALCNSSVSEAAFLAPTAAANDARLITWEEWSAERPAPAPFVFTGSRPHVATIAPHLRPTMSSELPKLDTVTSAEPWPLSRILRIRASSNAKARRSSGCRLQVAHGSARPCPPRHKPSVECLGRGEAKEIGRFGTSSRCSIIHATPRVPPGLLLLIHPRFTVPPR